MFKGLIIVVYYTETIRVVTRSTAQVCSLLTPGIAGSFPSEGMDFLVLCLLLVVQVAASSTG